MVARSHRRCNKRRTLPLWKRRGSHSRMTVKRPYRMHCASPGSRGPGLGRPSQLCVCSCSTKRRRRSLPQPCLRAAGRSWVHDHEVANPNRESRVHAVTANSVLFKPGLTRPASALPASKAARRFPASSSAEIGRLHVPSPIQTHRGSRSRGAVPLCDHFLKSPPPVRGSKRPRFHAGSR